MLSVESHMFSIQLNYIYPYKWFLILHPGVLKLGTGKQSIYLRSELLFFIYENLLALRAQQLSSF